MAFRGTVRSLVVLLIVSRSGDRIRCHGNRRHAAVDVVERALPGPYTILDNVLCTSSGQRRLERDLPRRRPDRGAVLPFSGRVYDSNWKPLAGTTVTLYRFGYRESGQGAPGG